MANLLQQWSEGMAAVVHGAHQSLVQITSDEGGLGAGTIWHPDGLIITNAHVVIEQYRGRMGMIQETMRRDLRAVLPDGETFPANLIAHDHHNDLAALAIEAADLPTIKPGDSQSLRPGQWVMALGHPWGVPGALTAGVVIGTGAQLPEIGDGREWIALSLKLRPGHSGGPLVDADGRLIGINTMITGPEVGFAIPVNTVKRFLKGTIGTTQPADPEDMPMIV